MSNILKSINKDFYNDVCKVYEKLGGRQGLEDWLLCDNKRWQEVYTAEELKDLSVEEIKELKKDTMKTREKRQDMFYKFCMTNFTPPVKDVVEPKQLDFFADLEGDLNNSPSIANNNKIKIEFV